MNKTMTSVITTLLFFLSGPVFAQAVGQESAEPQQPVSEQAPAEPAGTEQASVPGKAPEPITGAFGITLGKLFKPSMVAKVIDKQPHKYRGPEGTQLTGSLIQVEPVQPDERFQRYAVMTTDKDIVYAIRAEYQFELKKAKEDKDKAKRSTKFRKTCKNAVKSLAKEMEARHGKPRGAGWDGEWFAFRQFTENTDKSLRLYGNRCRSGIYSVVYTDQALLGIQAKPPKKPEKEEQQEQKPEQKEQEQGQEQVPESEQPS
jgi:hypothetical protein